MFNTENILTQMIQDGVKPPGPLIPDGEIHRFKVDLDDSKESGWYRGYQNFTPSAEEFFVFTYGNWKQSNEMFKSSSRIKLDPINKKWIEEKIKKAQIAHEKEKKTRNEKAAHDANEKWRSLTDDFGPNEYLDKKKFTELYGARLDGSVLIIPMRDISGEIRNLERIFPDGQKRGLAGGARIGLFHLIGEIKDVIYICEGFSTAVSVHIATESATVCAFNAGNLIPVAEAIAKKYPKKPIVICGDNDQWPSLKTGEINNAGLESAKDAANKSGGKYVVPQFKDETKRYTDFNDLHMSEGIEEVFNQIKSIKPKEIVQSYDREYIINFPYTDQNDKGVKKGTIKNIQELLERLNVAVRYNVITKEEEIIIGGSSYTIDNYANASYAYILDWCERVGIPSGNLGIFLTAIADANIFNPIKAWIDPDPWDGVSRLPDLYATIKAKNEDSDIHVLAMKEALIKRWMISAIAAAYEPNGVSAHGVLVLQGAQYMGKTAWFKKLVDPEIRQYIADGMSLNPDNKDSVFQAISKWMVELGELDATFKSDMSKLKAFITKDKDITRRPYAKKESNYGRRTVFFGSVNPLDFLKDPTGNRRFWTIECESIDYDHKINMQQVWAEVKELYLKGERWILTADEVQNLNAHNEQFETQSSIHEQILEFYDWGSVPRIGMTSTAVCKEIGYDNPTDRDLQAAGHALRKLTGSDRKHIKGLSSKGYLVPLKSKKNKLPSI